MALHPLRVLPVVLALASCDGGAALPPLEVSVPHSVVGGEARELQAKELFRVGSLSGDSGAIPFGYIRSIAFGQDSTLFVLDSQTSLVHVVSADGLPIDTLGGRGAGPGELSDGTTGLLIDNAGDLWVADRSYRRYTVFQRDGDVRTLNRDFRAGWTAFWGARRLEDGSIWEPLNVMFPGDDEATRAFVRLDERGGSVVAADTILRASRGEERQYWQVGFASTGNGISVGGQWPIPFTPATVDRVDPKGGFAAGRSSEPAIFFRDSEGDTTHAVVRSGWEFLTVGGRDRSWAERQLEERFGPGARVDLSRLPDVKPPWRTFYLDDVGRVWVMLTPTDPNSRTYRWEIWSRDGELLGAVQLPFDGVQPIRVSGALVAGVSVGALGEQTAVVYELPALR